MKTTKLLALLLALAMMLGMLAGCGGSGTSTEAPASEAPQESVEEVPEEAPAAPATPVEDEKDPTAVAGSAVEEALAEVEIPDLELPLTDEPVTLSFWTQAPGGQTGQLYPDFAEYPFFIEAQERTGITLNFIQENFMTANEKFNLMIAAQDYPDIFGKFNSMYSAGDDNGIEEEIIIALEDYEDLFPHYQKYRTSTRFLETATTTAEGHISGFYNMMSDFIGPFFGMMGRGDWIEEIGLGMPETYDELHEVLLAMKDKYGCTTTLMLDSAAVGNDNFLAAGYGIACMLQTNAKESYWMVQDGVVTDGITGEGYKEYLTMLHQWYEEGIINSDFTNAAGAMSADGMGDILSGNCGVFFNGAPMMSMYANSDDPNMHVVGMPDPVKEKGEITHVDTTEYDFGGEFMSVSTKCENPELAIQFCEFWFTDEGILLGNYGVEGLSYDMVDGVPTFNDNMMNNPDMAPGNAISFYTGRNTIPTWEANSRLLTTFSEDEKNAFSVWAASRDNRDAYPYVAQLTIDETEEIAKLAADYETYADECRQKFIVGEMDIEKDYATYEEQVRTMGLTRALEIKQDAYDRYMAK